MVLPEEKEYRRRHGKHYFIPAGVLIGLGAGLIAGQPAAGILIGLGLGFLASGLLPRRPVVADGDGHPACCRHGGRWISGIVGVFLILVGAAMVWAPAKFWAYVWPYGVGVLLILIGLTFIAMMGWQTASSGH